MTTTIQVPFVDLRAQHDALAPEIDRAVRQVFERGDFILGAAVEKFEGEFAAYHDVRHAIGVGTGLDAIEIALRAHGIGPGDEVITAANTFIATVLAILAVGARPVLVDADAERYTIDPGALSAAITSRTRAIVPVHLFGQPVDVDGVLAIARRYNLLVVEDAAQAHGARYNGQRVGGFGHAAAFSFYPSKNLGAYGDGGMIVTNDSETAQKLRLLRNYGQRAKYAHSIAGTNSRLDTVQAAILRVKLPHLDEWNAARRRHADAYGERLPARVQTPSSAAGVEHVYHLYVIETDHRDTVQQQLRAKEIATGIHYPVPVHLQEACADLGYRAGDFPVTERAAERMLSLPMYPELTPAQIEYVSDAVTEAVKRAG
ncbi:MAG: erythromycin biosynthesis sensory transduction protein eryC1 [Acidobacteria bacterium 13_1_40CM_65_14]|nr:MAG: erythromycin biosynthesis sensory transduction protein eryC1 [Acidobacteria bacterium 13_1_40CM_65_14]OLC80229.1 MAG: erythromycin biosynthesis sensory transduction protein eryC1 [Acidobacteria bacterium 13_1_40CM_4_65_8]